MKCTLCYRDCAVALHKPLYIPIFVDGRSEFNPKRRGSFILRFGRKLLADGMQC